MTKDDDKYERRDKCEKIINGPVNNDKINVISEKLRSHKLTLVAILQMKQITVRKFLVCF